MLGVFCEKCAAGMTLIRRHLMVDSHGRDHVARHRGQRTPHSRQLRLAATGSTTPGVGVARATQVAPGSGATM